MRVDGDDLGKRSGGGLNLRMRAELPQSILLVYTAP